MGILELVEPPRRLMLRNDASLDGPRGRVRELDVAQRSPKWFIAHLLTRAEHLRGHPVLVEQLQRHRFPGHCSAYARESVDEGGSRPQRPSSAAAGGPIWRSATRETRPAESPEEGGHELGAGFF